MIVWAIIFLALAIAARLLNLGNLAIACGLIALAIGWRPILERVRGSFAFWREPE